MLELMQTDTTERMKCICWCETLVGIQSLVVVLVHARGTSRVHVVFPT